VDLAAHARHLAGGAGTADRRPRRSSTQPLMNDQELDSRMSTGAVYWEGASELHRGRVSRVGRGYLEMTGYVAPIRL
jgi:hypothetical protein